MSEKDRATIADLEAYGLSLRAINMLEKSFGFIYIDQLTGLTKDMLLALPNVGPGIVVQICQALREWSGDQV